MRRISTPTAAQDLFGPGKHGFRNGDPANAILATRLAAEWFNALQEEVCSVVEQAGFPLDSGNNSQLAAAIVQLIRSNTIDTLNTQRIDIASAATINLTTSAPNTRHINITGTTAITGFTVAAGRCYFVRFAGALTLTNGASLVTQTGGNIVTAAGDTCILRATAANVVEVLSYMPTAMLDSTRIDVASAAAVNLTTLAPNTRHINITGTTTITSFTVAAGRCYFVRFAASLTLTNSASLVTQTGGNIVTAAGDTCILRATAANVVEVLSYTSVVANSIGVGQSWQDVLASRVSGTTYTNSTGRPIMVSVSRKKGANDMTVTVGGVIVARVEGYGLSDQDNLCFVVPDGQTYLVTASATPLGTWTELR